MILIDYMCECGHKLIDAIKDRICPVCEKCGNRMTKKPGVANAHRYRFKDTKDEQN